MDINAENPGFWAVLPAQVRYDAQLPSTAKLLYAEISALADQRGYCFAPNSYFMKLFRISERTLQDHLRALKAGGYIRIADGDGGHGRRRIYAGINPLRENPAENCGVPRKKLRGDPAENCGVHNKEENKKKEQNPLKPPKGGRRVKSIPEWEPEMFERLWRKYPRGEKRTKAVEEWDELRPDRKLMKVMSAALDRMLESDEWRRGYAPYLCTWLHQRRWEDDLSRLDAASSEPEPEEDDDEWLY